MLIGLLLTGCGGNKTKQTDEARRYQAIVQSVKVEEQLDSETGGRYVYQYLKVKPTEGPYKDKLLETQVSVDISNSKSYFTYHAGDAVIIEVYLNEAGQDRRRQLLYHGAAAVCAGRLPFAAGAHRHHRQEEGLENHCRYTGHHRGRVRRDRARHRRGRRPCFDCRPRLHRHHVYHHVHGGRLQPQGFGGCAGDHGRAGCAR